MVVGILVFFWLGTEDNSVQSAVLYGLGIASLSIAHAQYRLPKLLQLRRRLRFALLGAIIGLSAALFAALLMLLKTALHTHLFPDYSLPLIAAMLVRAPVWAVAGVLMGLGIALVAESNA
jgi:hypothetical protein